ncbi:hypothetical protein QU38_02860, partial [Staphylococcus aureus]
PRSGRLSARRGRARRPAPPRGCRKRAAQSRRGRASAQLAGGGQHLVGGLHDPAGHLLGALRGDQRRALGHGIDVRGLDRALHQRAETGIAGGAGDRRARSRGLEEQVAALGLQAAFVDESGELELAERLRRRVAREDDIDLAGLRDIHAHGVLRHGDARLDREAVGIDQLARVRHAERTVAGMAGGAVGQRDLEIAMALDRQVILVVGLLGRTLLVDPVDRAGLHARADLDAGGAHRLRAGRRTGAHDLL